MTPDRTIPEVLLERYLAGDVTAAQKQSIEATLAASATERARLEDLRADSSAFFIKHPVGPVVAKLEVPRRSAWLSWWVPALGAAAAMPVAGVFGLRFNDTDFAAKGSIALTAHRKTITGTEALAAGAVTHPGDEVRFELRAPYEGFVAVLSKDGAGQTSVYYPADAQTAAAYQPAAPMLPAATRLDAALGPERIIAVYGRQAFSLTPLLKAINDGQPLPAGLVVTELDWDKR